MSPDPFSRSKFGLPNKGALYFCPQRIEKVHPAFDRLLRGILETDGQGTVVMFRGRHPAAFDRLVARFGKTLGAKLFQRVTFVENLPNADYYRLLSLADVVLDTPNFSACLTGFDAFSLGIPLVTLPGKLKVQRYALALYRKMGIDDLIVEDESQYITTAVRLGTDEPFGQDIRHRIRQRSHLLFDDTEAIKQHERFFSSTHGSTVGRSPLAERDLTEGQFTAPGETTMRRNATNTSLGERLKGLFASPQRPRASMPGRRLRLEPLEERQLLAFLTVWCFG